MIYNVRFYSDMGHLLTSPDYTQFPKDINDFIWSKSSLYINTATDNSNLGCRFYILKPGLKNKWTYYYNSHIINITFDLDTYNSNTMKML